MIEYVVNLDPRVLADPVLKLRLDALVVELNRLAQLEIPETEKGPGGYSPVHI